MLLLISSLEFITISILGQMPLISLFQDAIWMESGLLHLIWNNLPVNIKKSKNLHTFKVFLQTFLLNPYVLLVLLGYITFT